MTTRLAQAGAELNAVGEFTAEDTTDAGSTSATISSTKSKTGTYSLRFGTTQHGRGLATPTNPTQLKGGFFINHNSTGTPASSRPAWIVSILPTSGAAHRVGWNGFNGNLEMYVNGVLTSSIAATGIFSVTDHWYHVGFTFKAHASTGYFTFYVDGVAILTFTGNTLATAISAVTAGGFFNLSTGAWPNFMYVDDFYVDDDTGGSDVAPNSPRFLWSLANAAGTNAEFTPLSSTNISNVDDTDASAPDDDTTYNFAAAAGLKDTFNTANITVPAGLQIAAAIPVAWAKKTNAGIASTIDLLAYNGTLTTGSAKTPTTAYGPVWDRFVTDPSAAAWTETTFNAAEFGYKSDGSY